ncbi:hypothetical protein TTHERM_00237350 (macronuclear) [Tetrahymena thermophila SB210]|uniref:Uncharacterized protein n=1 Tax=Tetrahymena thermophila (strain SB210) TaxID=312017 RepID=I7MMB3_TETTS|nr:hypothetical protein TTHERM_00237350 [Tetrahymena thermophila SB210]EAS04520.3 hypothetical protein TTHERM_00237350 [Tetrahymena thermophila SB210]|eukprot:XP_001024765.3 hypothetical protein TTHERM_00237350 [Tetrahymena thermophila SB210]
MHRSSTKANHNQFSSHKQQIFSANPLVNSEVGQLIGKKAQLLFPQFDIEQEEFIKGDIEQAIASFVVNLQSPQNKFDLESTMMKMRKIADEQEKKIQKSINKDNQYTEEDAFGFTSAMKYQFKAQFDNLEEQKKNGQIFDNSLISEKMQLTHKFPQLQAHSQSTPQTQQGETKQYVTPMKSGGHSSAVNPLCDSARVNTSAGPSTHTIQSNNINQIQQQQSQQQLLQVQGSNQNTLASNANQSNSQNIPIQYLPPQQQYYQYPYSYHPNSQNTAPYFLTAQKENNFPPNNFHHQYHPNYNQFNFHPYPPPHHHIQHQQQQNFNSYSENQNPMAFMSAPPGGPSYGGNNTKFLPRVPIKTNQYHQKNTSSYLNEQEQLKKQQYLQNSNNSQQLGSKQQALQQQQQVQQPQQQFQNSNNPTQQQEQSFQYPTQISQQQQQPEDIQIDEQISVSLKRINSLESVQQQLNFDVVKNDESLLKSSKLIENSSDTKHNMNNSNNQNCIEEFLRESRISCEGEDILSNNKLSLSPSISIKNVKNDINEFERSINQDSYPCELISNHRIPLSDQSTMINIKSENQHIEKLLRYEHLHKNSNFNDFMHYESNSDLNFMMEENPIQHLNQCDFDKYID